MAQPWESKPVDKVEIGPCEGQYFTQWRIDELRSIAEHINAQVEITNCKIWYDRPNDFHVLDFDVDGHHYHIELYKIITVRREDKMNDAKYFRQGTASWDIALMFRAGRHLTWAPGPTSD